MTHRVDHYREALAEHLTEREWHPKEVESFVTMIGRSALSSYQSALNILEYQQAVDEQVQAEKQHDTVFMPEQPTLFDTPQLEVTDVTQAHFVERFREVN